MFTLPAISGNSRYCADSSGIMPLNALNGSSYMYNDESSTLSRPPSYEEAVSSDSMFGLFIVNSGDSYHNSVSHQHAHHDQLDQPPNYHDLLSPTGSTASADKPSNRNAPYVSRDSDTAEYLDTSLDNQCTRFSQIDIVGSTSTLTSPVPSPRPHSRKHESKKSDKTKVRTGSSSGWRKHLSSEKSALSVARDRLYRVLSPALSRRSEHLESHKKGGSGKVQLCSPRGQDSEEEEATSHPVRMHISSSRHRSGGADHFDDIRSSGKPHKDKQRHKHGDRRDK
ncbi:uncharacterized protein LOC112553279 isoform X1 [Pomacea canaliculata]|uniref:uncharacterized protein LOC112553279 isoform X1 n=1 Tax=Pomacea canaliculata TaxID=400727 RepID=UPI000D72C6BD|nr:uncharacterized protein LOC112553279 isoform X1 [Pomacea canaliculata]